MFNPLEVEMKKWRHEAPAAGYTVREGEGGRFFIYRVDRDSPLANSLSDADAWKIAYALSVAFPPAQQQ
jgi:hypothetical protein